MPLFIIPVLTGLAGLVVGFMSADVMAGLIKVCVLCAIAFGIYKSGVIKL